MSGDSEDADVWLAGADLEHWRSVTGMLATLPTALDAQLKRDAGMNLYEFQVLLALADQPRATLAMSDLARLTQSSPSRLSHAVARLERSGWVGRLECAEAGKRTSAQLTTEGRDHLERVAPGHAREVRRLVVDALGPERMAALGEAARTVAERAGLDTDVTAADRCVIAITGGPGDQR